MMGSSGIQRKMMYKLISENLSNLGNQGSNSINFTRYFDSLANAKRAAQEDYYYRQRSNEKITWVQTCDNHRAMTDFNVIYNISKVNVE